MYTNGFLYSTFDDTISLLLGWIHGIWHKTGYYPSLTEMKEFWGQFPRLHYNSINTYSAPFDLQYSAENLAIWKTLGKRYSQNQFRCRILGSNWDKSLKSCSLCYSQSHLLPDFTPLPRLPWEKRGLKLVCIVNIVYGNLKFDHFQDYAQEPQRNWPFMNSASCLLISWAVVNACLIEEFEGPVVYWNLIHLEMKNTFINLLDLHALP